jgi:hemoglobin-like flavoprotein
LSKQQKRALTAVENEISLVNESFGRALASGGLFDRFYDIFLKSHPDIASLFANTEFSQQKELLEQGVSLGVMFVAGNPVGKRGLDRIRNSHSKNRLNINPGLYPYWKNSFLQAVSEFDPGFSPEDRDAWDKVLQKITDYIAEGYD